MRLDPTVVCYESCCGARDAQLAAFRMWLNGRACSCFDTIGGLGTKLAETKRYELVQQCCTEE